VEATVNWKSCNEGKRDQQLQKIVAMAWLHAVHKASGDHSKPKLVYGRKTGVKFAYHP
jgi:hypothetical protein